MGLIGGRFVWDVGAYPDMADLVATTDTLNTDYSSVMLDCADTRSPATLGTTRIGGVAAARACDLDDGFGTVRVVDRMPPIAPKGA